MKTYIVALAFALAGCAGTTTQQSAAPAAGGDKVTIRIGSPFKTGHILVDVVWEISGKTARLAIDRFASTVSLVFMAVFAWKLLERFPAVLRAHQLTSDLKLPIWPFYAIGAVGIVAAAIVGGIRVIELFRAKSGDAQAG